MKQRLPDHLKELAQRVAQHEMGHYVVARAMGFRTGDVSVELTGPIDGHRGAAEITLPEPTGTMELIADYIARRVIVLYAGGAAETLPGDGAPSRAVDVERAVDIIRNPGQGAEQDHAKVRELIQVLRNVTRADTDVSDTAKVQSELDELDGQLFGRAVELVEMHAATIVGLAGNLADRIRRIGERVTLTAAYLESLSAVQEIATVEAMPAGEASESELEDRS
uniref:Peptidase M41 domain-containing protein n=1 Tax=Bosea sp. NBC_00436 TaxID=2969620 RepID=A0A9E7ZJK2_9HYPH